MVKIGSQNIDANIFLAPMSGCTDLPCRLISRDYGAKFCFYEMIDAHSLIYKSVKGDSEYFKTTHNDWPIAGQLLGADEETMLKAAKIFLSLRKLSFLDINAACPVKKVIKKKAGATLLKNPTQLNKIIKTLATKLDLPITVKLRIGYTKADNKEIVKIAKDCQKHGASAIFIHGRTQKQGYSGEVNYQAIAAVKEAVNIPVFGSGNIFTPELAKKMLDETGCDGIMVARGALGNPWIFRGIEQYLQTGTVLPAPSREERLKAMRIHLNYILQYKHPKNMIGFLRKIAIWYTKSFPNASKMRQEIGEMKSVEELITTLIR
ncbi:MAG: tRNA dihydrouridine synthase DusB [Candidatus Margulisbacteria bacterium]|nr:tRNA dihydrouridine synthase DusB [Candidatus Margulisiibacteriota bacterium]